MRPRMFRAVAQRHLDYDGPARPCHTVKLMHRGTVVMNMLEHVTANHKVESLLAKR